MDDQDQRRTHAQGQESHGVHVCHKCGWPFPNPHPSAKQRRAHKKICGTIEGCKLIVSVSQTRPNASDDEHLSDDDRNTQGENEKQNGGTGEKLIRSGDEVFLDAIANFSDGALSPGTKEPLRDSLGSATDAEIVDIKKPEFSGYSVDNNFNAAGVSENVRDCSLTFVAKEINLKGKDEIESDTDMVEIVVSSDNTGGKTCEGVPKLAVGDVVNSDCQVAGGAFNLKEKNNAEFLSVMPQDELPLEVNSTISTDASTNGVQVETAHMIQFATSSDVKMLQERGEGNINVFTHPSCDDGPDVAHPQNKYEDVKEHEGVLLQNSLNLHSSEALKHKRDDLKDSVADEKNFLINQSQLSEKDVLPDVHVLDRSKKEQNNSELVDEEMHAEDSIEVSFVKFMVGSDKRLVETGASMNAMKTEMNERYMIHFSEEQESDDVHKNSQQISSPEGSFMAASKENPSDASFGGTETTSVISTSVISPDNVSHHEKNIKEINDVAVDGKCRGANVENDIGISMRTLQPSNLHLDVKPSSGVYKSDEAVEMGKIEKCDITDGQYMEGPIMKDTSLSKFASSNFECPILSEVVMDRSIRTQKGVECTDRGLLSGAQDDIKDDEINSDGRGNEECNRYFGSSVGSHQAQDEELIVKAAEDPGRNYSSLSSLNIETSQCISVVEDAQDGEPGRKVFGSTVVPVQDQSGNGKDKLASSAIYTSVDSGSRFDSLEGNWGSVSVSGLPSTDLLSSTEAEKFNLKDPKAASDRQQCEKAEMFEPPSFMTLVEPGHVVGPKSVASDVQNGPNQHTSSQAGWFPTITSITNESQGRKRNEEKIAKITKWSPSEKHTPLKTLLGEAAHNKKPKSPKLEENSVNQKISEVREDNGSGLTTGNSILGPESPATQAVKGKDGKEWNSPARYPAGIKRENKKAKGRPYWIQFVCCSSQSSVDPR